MVCSDEQFVIYVKGPHGPEVYAYSVDSALRLVLDAVANHPDLLDVEAALDAAHAGAGPHLRSQSWLIEALEEVVATPPGEPLPKLQTILYGAATDEAVDTRPAVVCDAAWRDELVLWCFNQDVNPRGLAAADKALPREDPWKAFSFLQAAQVRFPRGVRLVSSLYLDGARELRVLRRKNWKPTAKEIAVVMRHICFLNEWGRGDWDVLKIQGACAE